MREPPSDVKELLYVPFDFGGEIERVVYSKEQYRIKTTSAESFASLSLCAADAHS